jgi:CP family cyanate transporter-like MFS transporter
MGFGVAIFQPALPTLVRLWAPARTWLANAFSTNGMLVGATLSSALTIPVVLPLIGASWRLDVLIWSVPGCVAALLYAVAAPRPKSAEKTAEAAVQLPPARWWPDWSASFIWKIGLTFGMANAMYFDANGFLPGYLPRPAKANGSAPH